MISNLSFCSSYRPRRAWLPCPRALALPVALLAGSLAFGATSAAQLEAAASAPSAQTSPDANAASRARFLEAERAAQARDWPTYTRLEATLQDYPLLPYLHMARILALNSAASDAQLRDFITRHADLPTVGRVRAVYLRRLAATRRWKAFASVYRGGGDASLRCHHAHALWRTGAKQARAATVELWRTGRSAPDACDPAFEALEKAGGLTPELVLDRVELAVRAGNPGLARYLERFLPKRLRPRATLWRTLREDPARIASVTPGAHRQAGAMTRYAFGRLARRNIDAAMQLWRRMSAKHSYPVEVRRAVARHIGLELATDHDPRAVAWLAAVDDAVADEDLRAWRILSALRHGRTAAARAALERLPAGERADQRWQYWEARVLGLEGKQAAAGALYAKLAVHRSFYGFLAADHADLPYTLAADEQPPPAAELAGLAADPQAVRAHELLALERPIDARREWFDLVARLPTASLATAAYLAHRWQWHGAAILTMARAERFDEVSVRFPTPHQELAEAAAAASGIEATWVMAVIRQESAFMLGARSPKGALGLMQIMPATGRRIARRLGTRLQASAALQDPALNVRFGASYLATVRNDLGGQQALATAAYNAGPHRVRRWLPAAGSIPGDVWVETIPFRETRQYTRRVLAYQAVYAMRTQQPLLRLRARLPDVPTLAVLKANRTEQAAARKPEVDSSG